MAVLHQLGNRLARFEARDGAREDEEDISLHGESRESCPTDRRILAGSQKKPVAREAREKTRMKPLQRVCGID